MLVAAVVVPDRATSLQATQQHCTGLTCKTAGSILWTKRLAGSWLAESGVAGTVNSQSAAYAASGNGVAVIGSGTSLSAYQLSTGVLMWQSSISANVPAGSVVVGVRIFSGVIAVGMAAPGDTTQDELILSAATGQIIRIYPAAAYGGAIEADSATTVVVGTRSVTAYANDTGRVLWSRVIGRAGQTWRVSGQDLYVAETASGPFGSSGVTALRRIDLKTGLERAVHPPGSRFPGSLTAVVNGVALFSGSGGIWAYDGLTGQQIWHKAPAVLDLADAEQGIVYLGSGSKLIGVDVASGTQLSRGATSVAASLYTVNDGVALGLDQDALGEAWGFDLSTRRVVWTSAALPWPHFFTDLSGLDDSASADSDMVVLAICAQVGPAPSAGSPPACVRPELAAVRV